MNRGSPGVRSVRIANWGHAVFAATMIVFGILSLVRGKFTAIWLPVTEVVPAREVLVYLSAIVPLASGIGLFWRRTADVASGVLLGFLLAWLLLLDMPQLVLDPSMEFTWAAAKTATIVAAAWVLYVWVARRPGPREGPWDGGRAGQRDPYRPAFAAGDRGLQSARALYGLALIVFGISHFTYLARTISMVPGWLPWHLFWACFFGFTFIAAGLAVLIGVVARLAAMLSVLQLALFTLLVWVPVAAAGPRASDWAEFVVSWALTAAAWVVAESYRGDSFGR